MKAILMSLLIGAGVITNTFSYPISPRPLRKLIIESEFIVAGHVQNVRDSKKKKEDDYWGGYIAEIVIMEVLQGQIKETIIEVSFNPNMICPQPAHYRKDADVLVFLQKNNSTYTTHALSYGSKTLSLSEIEVYKLRIKEMQEILKISDKDQQFHETTEWLVTCAENRVTRHEGVYELSPRSDFMSYYDRTEKEPYEYGISAEQKARLKKALLATEKPSFSEFGLVDLVYLGNEKEIFDYLLIGLRNLDEGNYWVADGYMERLCLVKSSEKLKEFIENYEDIKYNDSSDEANQKLKAILTSFVEEIEKM